VENKIYKRQIIDEIEKYLPTQDIIVLHGARQVGKTSILTYLKNQLQNQKGEEVPEIIETNSQDLEKKPKESVEIEKGTVVATYY